MSEGMVKLIKRNKPSITLENNLNPAYRNMEDFHNVLLDLVEDEEFVALCEEGSKEKAIMYLAEKGIVGLKVSKSINNSTDVIAYPEVAIAGIEVLVLVCAVAVIAPTIIFTVRETESSTSFNSTFYTSEFDYCMEIISKIGSEKFTREMSEFFKAIENGDRYVLNTAQVEEFSK